MKQGCQGVSVAMPLEMVGKLDRLRGGSRTHHVNKAVRTYLEVQGHPAVNRFGVDCDYFRGKLGQLMERIDNYTPGELSVALGRLSATAAGVQLEKSEVMHVQV